MYGRAGLGHVLGLATWLWHGADTVEARVGQALTPWDWAGHLALAESWPGLGRYGRPGIGLVTWLWQRAGLG